MLLGSYQLLRSCSNHVASAHCNRTRLFCTCACKCTHNLRRLHTYPHTRACTCTCVRAHTPTGQHTHPRAFCHLHPLRVQHLSPEQVLGFMKRGDDHPLLIVNYITMAAKEEAKDPNRCVLESVHFVCVRVCVWCAPMMFQLRSCREER